jgi:pimeloyl-ACP methyl ester carboxylesterase
MAHAQVGDIGLYYELIDCTEPWTTGKPPVLLIHGLGGDHQNWLYQIPALCGRYPSLSVDLRGHGASSPAASDYSIADMALDLVRLLRVLGIEKVHVVGLSLGGLVAQQFALDFPYATASLLLAGTFCAIPSEMRQVAAESLRFIEDNTMAAIASARITAAFSDGVNPTMRGYVIDRIAGNDKTAYLRAARATFAFSAADRLNDVQVPALVVVGEHDRVTPPVLSEMLASRIAGARLVRIADAGHICVMEQPGAFNQVMLEFLDAL